MAVEWRYSSDKKQIILPNGKPKALLKVTGTRFASILGLNNWATPFQMWCQITKAARVPFEGNMYTEFGNIVEPKVVQYYKDQINENTLGPEEYYGMRYRNIRYDFFPEEKIFGGMWDAVVTKKDMKTIRAIGEVKTTKRSQDWLDGPPIYYLLQVLLYAYLSKVDRVFISGCFLEDDDYNHPELFEVTDKNTKIYPYKVSTFTWFGNIMGEEKEWTFKEMFDKVNVWYDTYIKLGISPEFDEQKDSEFLAILRQTSPKNDNSIDQVVEEINNLETTIDGIKKDKELTSLEKRVKTLKDGLKDMLKDQMGDDDTSISYMNFKYSQATSKKVVDEKKLKAAGLYDTYSMMKEGSWALRKIKVKESEDL